MSALLDQIVNVGDNGQVLTSSLIVANAFNKNHRDVLRAITNKMKVAGSEFGRRNFAQSSYLNEQGKEQPMYLLTKEGFALVAMSFTGEKAVEWQIRFINAFQEMQDRLAKQSVDNFAVPKTFAQALALAAKAEAEREALAARVEADAPKVAFAKQIGSATGDIAIADVAKALNDPDWKQPHWGRDRLFEYLRSIGWVEKNRRDLNGNIIEGNSPRQEAIEQGLMRQRFNTIERTNGDKITVTPFLTPKGIVKLWMRMRSEGLTVVENMPHFASETLAC